ncbi:abortive infection family protein [Thiobacillus sp. 65-1402]|uniref:abortive infection family protein n=1 Tax=Thiobacillus sp. 65-1402 TaxID=1895861 RepID=UPI000B0D266C|nr:abortive infection family protein [Thiobacillus sp. 65-1402]
MSSLNMREKRVLEDFLGMGGGYVLNFSDRTFGEFVHEAVDIEIHSDEYSIHGSSKAKKLRAFWEVESDYLVGRLLNALIDYAQDTAREPTEEAKKLAERAREIASRLLAGGPSLDDLKQKAKSLDANHLAEQIRRMEDSVETDPSLAIGTAKELIETCCKTILSERGQEISGTPDIPTLTKATLKELNLVPEGVPNAARGADVIKRLLSNLSTIGHGLAELRGLYGTGHGQHGSTSGLTTRHAKLAVGAASTLAVFLFETHEQTK